MRRCLGVWNAYVEQGASQPMRRARLEEVPAELRDQVQRHVQTVFALRRKAQAKKNRWRDHVVRRRPRVQPRYCGTNTGYRL